MATESYEFTGKSVDEALAEGLRALNLRSDQVELEVISKGSRGIFGLGSEPAHIRLTRRMPTPPVVPAPASPPAPMPTPTETVLPARNEQAEVAMDETPASPIATLEPSSPATDASVDEPASDADTADDANRTGAADDDSEVVAIATELLGETVRLIGFEATVVTSWRTGNDELNEHDDRYLLLDVQGGELGSLIGRRGETLEHLQYLLRLMVNQRLRRWQNIVVDVEGYKERRVQQLKQLAERTATQVAATGRAVALEPMPPNERRIVHIALRDHPDVYTESLGEGDRRKVQILAKA